MKNSAYFLIYICLFFFGCTTLSNDNRLEAVQGEDQDAMLSVAEALAGKEFTEEDLKDIGRDIRNDPEAQSAIESLTGSLQTGNQSVKYCPSTGRRYAPHLDTADDCPEKLLWLD